MAGTDANVYLVLFGEWGVSREIQLEPGSFERKRYKFHRNLLHKYMFFKVFTYTAVRCIGAL